MVKRNYPPGFHGPKGKGRLTEYGLQLNEKQKAKRQYGMREKQFRILFDQAHSKTGNTGDNFLASLEMRFDNAIYRLGMAASRAQARQLISHGHFTVNGRRMDIPSYVVKTDDVVAIKANKTNVKNFKDLADKLKKHETPGWLNLDLKEMTGKVLHKPEVASLQASFDVRMIVEYYSK